MPAARVGDPAIKARLKSNTDEAIAAGVWGVPTFVVDGLCFWGFDAGEMLLDYLADPSLFLTAEHARVASVAGDRPPKEAGTVKPSRSSFVGVRGLRYHVREWGDPSAPKLFLLHGWMDVSASFQFTVDELQREWCVIAPDWRGFGLSEWTNQGYWFPDYIADLDAILERYSPGRARTHRRPQHGRQHGQSLCGYPAGARGQADPRRGVRFAAHQPRRGARAIPKMAGGNP